MVGSHRRNDRLSRRQARLTPLPTLVGLHQAENAALAVAMIRHQDAVHVSPEAMAAGIRAARWPARACKGLAMVR
jgi:dihydrofolate synthase/folylpolyglutamate synthase